MGFDRAFADIEHAGHLLGLQMLRDQPKDFLLPFRQRLNA